MPEPTGHRQWQSRCWAADRLTVPVKVGVGLFVTCEFTVTTGGMRVDVQVAEVDAGNRGSNRTMGTL